MPDVPDASLSRLALRADLILDALREGVYGLDREGRVEFINDAGARIVGWSAAEQLGSRQHERIHHHRADGTPFPIEECPIHRALAEQRVYDVAEDVFWRADGTPVPVEYTAAPVEENGEVIGVVVAFRDISERRAAEQLRLRAAELAAADAEHRRIIAVLQQAVTPSPPALVGFEVGLHYRPAEQDEPTGGDLYDLLPLPDGDVHLAVVDVVGHGIEATRGALGIIHAVRALTLEGWPLARVLAQAAEVVGRQDPDLLATVLVARISAAHDRVAIASAGHPPPVVLHANGSVEYLQASGTVLGAPGAGSDGVAEAPLGPGDALLVYTDGLVEATKDAFAGIARLGDVLAATVGPPASRVEQVAGAMALGGIHLDDVLALLVVRAAGSAPA